MATAGDVITLVKTMNAMDMEELGTDAQQTDKLIIFLNRALKELAHLAYRTKVSDVLNIETDGYKTFQRGSVDITDLYAPLRILDPTGRDTNKRTSYAAPTGWWRESDAQQIHCKGMSGNHTLVYVAYPTAVTTTSSPLDFPEAGMMALAFWVIGIAKESRNAYEESNAMYARARERLKVLVLANEAARGVSSGGYVPSINDVDRAFKF
jgi:hypothetical protein